MVRPEIEEYAIAHTTDPSAAVARLRAETEATMPIPEMAGGRVETRLLEALVTATRATRVLEIGTFTGVTALSIAERLPDGGVVDHARGGRDSTRRSRAGISTRARFATASSSWSETPSRSLKTLDGPFDVVFIDAWKPDYLAYYEAVLPKLADNGVIVADNVLREGDVLDPADDDEGTRALVAFADHVQADDRVDNALLTVADGLLLVWKRRA